MATSHINTIYEVDTDRKETAMLNATIKERTSNITIEVKTALEKMEQACEIWEHKCDEAYCEVVTCEDLILFYDTPEVAKRLARAYNRNRHYDYIYHKIVDKCEALEEALNGLEKALYWL